MNKTKPYSRMTEDEKGWVDEKLEFLQVLGFHINSTVDFPAVSHKDVPDHIFDVHTLKMREIIKTVFNHGKYRSDRYPNPQLSTGTV